MRRKNLSNYHLISLPVKFMANSRENLVISVNRNKEGISAFLASRFSCAPLMKFSMWSRVNESAARHFINQAQIPNPKRLARAVFYYRPFPGKGAQFVFHSKKRNDHDLQGWSVCFMSNTPDSLFLKMTVIGYKGGGLAIELKLNPRRNKETVNCYLESKELLIHIPDTVYTFDFRLLKKLFEILVNYNQLPVEYVQLISDLVKYGNWQLARPNLLEEIFPNPEELPD